MERQRATIAGWIGAYDGTAAARRNALFVGVLAAQVLAFVGAAASGNIPDAVFVLFRALLTL